MRVTALNLPGGQLSTSRIEELSAMLAVEADKRR